jgi:hypothetical protein
MILTKEARTLLRRICEMADTDVDPIISNVDLARSGDWTPDEIREILDPYDGLYVRAVSRYEDIRPDEPSGVRYQLAEEGRLLCELEANKGAP